MINYMMFVYILAGVAILAAIVCILLFFLRKYMTMLVDKRISAYQNDLMIKHCAEVQNMYSQMRGWRHDYHNHIQAMKAFLTLGQEAEHSAYLSKLDTDLTSVDMMIKTGNVMVDAILNSKISLVASKKIDINVKAAVPEELRISEIDLCVIIGNLIDNALEACMKLQDETKRFIRVYIGRHKKMIYISVTNAATDDIKKMGKAYLSTKASLSHGFGLMRIDRITEKYGGFVNRQHEEGAFATEITLPL